MDLHGTNVVIIGGGSGMGLATAELAKQSGAIVTNASRSNERLQIAVKVPGDVQSKVANFKIESDVLHCLMSLITSIMFLFQQVNISAPA